MIKVEKTTSDYYTVDMENFRLVPAINLLVPERFDITAKIIYARHKTINVAMDWAEHIYHSHLFHWLRGDIREFDGKKNSFKEFKSHFDLLLESVSKFGVCANKGTVPLLKNGAIANGSHRVAAGIVLNKSIPVVDVTGQDHNYSADFFVSQNTPEDVLDAMALEYCLRKKNVRIAVIFPMARKKLGEVRQELSIVGKIVLEKDIVFERTAMINLMHILYEGEPWLQVGKGITRSVMKHIKVRYEAGKPVRFMIIDCSGNDDDILKNTTDAKKTIRDIFDSGNFPIHINDSFKETIALACQIFHRQSLELLDCSDTYNAPDFINFVRQAKSNLNVDKWHDFVIDSGGVLAAYGLRDTRDLDYIAISAIDELEALPFCSLHDEVMDLYDNSPEELVYDPRNYVYFLGLKIVSPILLIGMKTKRGEVKDKRDVILLASLNDKHTGFKKTWKKIISNIKFYPILIKGHIRGKRKSLQRKIRSLFK
jgi:hypothetical protein